MPLLFNRLSRFVIAFLSRSKLSYFLGCNYCPQWFWSPKKWILSLLQLFSLLFAMNWWDEMLWSLVFECWVLRQLIHSLSPSSSDSLVPLQYLPLGCYHLHIWGCWYLSWQSWFQLVCDSSSPEFHMIYSPYKWNKQVTIYSLDICLSQFWTSPLFHIWF